MHDHDKSLQERLSTIAREGGLLFRDLGRAARGAVQGLTHRLGLGGGSKAIPASSGGVQNPAAKPDREPDQTEVEEETPGPHESLGTGAHEPEEVPSRAGGEDLSTPAAEKISAEEVAEESAESSEPEADSEEPGGEDTTSPEGYRAGQIWRPAADGKQARKVTAITEEMGEYYIVWEPPEGGKANRIKETSFTRWVRREKAETD